MANPSGDRRNLHIISFNGQTVPDGFSPDGTYDIYADHRPQELIIYPLPAPTDDNGNGRGIGIRGWHRAKLGFTLISDATYQWWAEKVSEGEADVPVVTVILRSADRRVGADGPAFHRMWINGLLTRITSIEGLKPVIMGDGKFWYEGAIEVWFNRLGGVPEAVPTP
jgi:hypothetical protein